MAIHKSHKHSSFDCSFGLNSLLFKYTSTTDLLSMGKPRKTVSLTGKISKMKFRKWAYFNLNDEYRQMQTTIGGTPITFQWFVVSSKNRVSGLLTKCVGRWLVDWDTSSYYGNKPARFSCQPLAPVRTDKKILCPPDRTFEPIYFADHCAIQILIYSLYIIMSKHFLHRDSFRVPCFRPTPSLKSLRNENKTSWLHSY